MIQQDTPADAPYVKRHGADTAADWLRVSLFSALVSRVDGLATAPPLAKDESSGTIAYEKLPEVQLLLVAPRPASMFRRFGQLLARLHSLELQTGSTQHRVTTYPLEEFELEPQHRCLLEARIPSGFFWGDCWHGNVFIHADGRFFVIDPLPHRWLFNDSHLRANGALDLAMLHMSLFYSHPLLKLARIDPGIYMAQAQALLEGYLEEVGGMVALPSVVRLSHVLATRYIAAYRRRLLWPIAVTKQKLSARIMSRLDARIGEVI